jgi:riboflavin kinase/FMN adenylyltransferase
VCKELLIGKTKAYSGNGRKLGYPTANIGVETDLADGVYFGFATLGKFVDHLAMIFIGVPTTVGDTERRVEAHLFDVEDRDYYGQKIKIEVCHFHRSNQKFNSVADLTAAIQEDEIAARKWYNNLKDGK